MDEFHADPFHRHDAPTRGGPRGPSQLESFLRRHQPDPPGGGLTPGPQWQSSGPSPRSEGGLTLASRRKHDGHANVVREMKARRPRQKIPQHPQQPQSQQWGFEAAFGGPCSQSPPQRLHRAAHGGARQPQSPAGPPRLTPPRDAHARASARPGRSRLYADPHASSRSRSTVRRTANRTVELASAYRSTRQDDGESDAGSVVSAGGRSTFGLPSLSLSGSGSSAEALGGFPYQQQRPRQGRPQHAQHPHNGPNLTRPSLDGLLSSNRSNRGGDDGSSVASGSGSVAARRRARSRMRGGGAGGGAPVSSAPPGRKGGGAPRALAPPAATAQGSARQRMKMRMRGSNSSTASPRTPTENGSVGSSAGGTSSAAGVRLSPPRQRLSLFSQQIDQEVGEALSALHLQDLALDFDFGRADSAASQLSASSEYSFGGSFASTRSGGNSGSVNNAGDNTESTSVAHRWSGETGVSSGDVVANNYGGGGNGGGKIAVDKASATGRGSGESGILDSSTEKSGRTSSAAGLAAMRNGGGHAAWENPSPPHPAPPGAAVFSPKFPSGVTHNHGKLSWSPSLGNHGGGSGGGVGGRAASPHTVSTRSMTIEGTAEHGSLPWPAPRAASTGIGTIPEAGSREQQHGGHAPDNVPLGPGVATGPGRVAPVISVAPPSESSSLTDEGSDGWHMAHGGQPNMFKDAARAGSTFHRAKRIVRPGEGQPPGLAAGVAADGGGPVCAPPLAPLAGAAQPSAEKGASGRLPATPSPLPPSPVRNSPFFEKDRKGPSNHLPPITPTDHSGRGSTMKDHLPVSTILFPLLVVGGRRLWSL